jgi:hypothetical protein
MSKITTNLGSNYNVGDFFIVAVFQQDTPTISRMGQVWFDHAESFPPAYWADPMYLNVNTHSDPAAVQEFIQQANITRYPTLLFVKVTPSGFEIQTRLEGEQGYNRIKDTMQAVATGNLSQWLDGDNPEGSFGLGLFNFNTNWLVWAVALALFLAGRKSDKR